jgi:hypothetical protein
MKSKIMVIAYVILVMVLWACDENEGLLGGHNETNVEGLAKDYRTVKIEGCEYIIYDVVKGYGLAGFGMHKGNCTSEVHKCN